MTRNPLQNVVGCRRIERIDVNTESLAHSADPLFKLRVVGDDASIILTPENVEEVLRTGRTQAGATGHRGGRLQLILAVRLVPRSGRVHDGVIVLIRDLLEPALEALGEAGRSASRGAGRHGHGRHRQTRPTMTVPPAYGREVWHARAIFARWMPRWMLAPGLAL